MRVVIVGGGIAGLSVGAHLCDRGAEVTLLEREPLIASHATARNAAIFLPVEKDELSLRLAVRHAEVASTWIGPGWLNRVGALLIAREETALAGLEKRAQSAGFSTELVQQRDLARRVPVLEGGATTAGLCIDDAGVIDIHEMRMALARRVSARGLIHTNAAVEHIDVRHGVFSGLRLADGTRIAADALVLCAGAWSGDFAARCAWSSMLVPLRRHLFVLPLPRPSFEADPSRWPVVWTYDAEDELYFRYESGGILASPCDEVPWAPGVPPMDPDAATWLAERVAAWAPSVLEAGIRTGWACLRTFAPDRMPVCGPDPEVGRVFWHAGLGGQGMSVALATGEHVARAVMGGADIPQGIRADRFGASTSTRIASPFDHA